MKLIIYNIKKKMKLIIYNIKKKIRFTILSLFELNSVFFSKP